MASKSYRTLGTNAIPSNYNLKIEPDLSKFEYFGTVVIDVNVKRKTKSIKLNSSELNILKAMISFKKDQECKIKNDAKNEEITLSFSNPVSGRGKIYIEFMGKNNDFMYGFYRSKYADGGQTEYMLSSQFEPDGARAALPCFDEPATKSTFDISFIIDKDLTAISNMPIKSEIDAGQKKVVTFERSPIMSTYLLYLAVGKFDRVEKPVGNIKLGVYTVPGKGKYTKLAIGYLEKALKFFEDYFRIKYPLPKLDLIAVPDFSAGAMENWGAITFREIELLGDEDTSVARKERIAEVIAHELAHQWFGNLVTMKWWDDLWLNESFAEYMAFKALDEMFPQWNTSLRYFDDVIMPAFSADCIKSTHPISVPIRSVKEVEQIFDKISYEKGGSILFMLENYIGKEDFRLGLHKYLTKHAYKNATKENLWNSIQEVSDSKEIVKMMNSWINKIGYPIVYVERTSDGYSLKQKRYILNEDREDKPWPIPIIFKDNKNDVKHFLMDKKSWGIRSQSPWIRLNIEQSGFYRTFYSDEIRDQLVDQARRGEIGSLGLWGMASDLFSFTRSGRLTMLDYLKFIEDCCMEADYPLMTSVSGGLSWSYFMSKGLGIEKAIERTSLAFHDKLFQKLGWEQKRNERNIDTKMRGAVIAQLGDLGNEEIQKKAIKIFNESKGGKELDSNIRGAVYSIVAANGNSKTFEMFADMFKKETVPEEQRRLLKTLGIFRAPVLAQKALDFSLSENVRPQDGWVIPVMVSNNKMCCHLLWPWMKNNWKRLLEMYPPGAKILKTFVEMLTYAADKETRNDIKGFFNKKQNWRVDFGQFIDQTLEKIDANIKFRQKNSSLMSSRSS